MFKILLLFSRGLEARRVYIPSLGKTRGQLFQGLEKACVSFSKWHGPLARETSLTGGTPVPRVFQSLENPPLGRRSARAKPGRHGNFFRPYGTFRVGGCALPALKCRPTCEASRRDVEPHSRLVPHETDHRGEQAIPHFAKCGIGKRARLDPWARRRIPHLARCGMQGNLRRLCVPAHESAGAGGRF